MAATSTTYEQSRPAIGFNLPNHEPPRPPARRRRGSRGPQHQSPFFQAANNPPGTQTQLSFEAKYYGPCPEISAEDESPVLDNVLDLMATHKSEGTVARCILYFSEQGLAVSDRKVNRTIVAWSTKNMASCATIKHPSAKKRRIGLFKIRDPVTHELTWHLFKYYCAKIDHMSDCFRFVVDCSLRDIGKAYAAQVAEELRHAADANRNPPAWEDVVPPAYDAPAYEEVVMESPTAIQPPAGSARRKLVFSPENCDSNSVETLIRPHQRAESSTLNREPIQNSFFAGEPAESLGDETGYLEIQ